MIDGAPAGARYAVPLALDPRAFAGLAPIARVESLAGTAMGTGWRVQFSAAPGFDLSGLNLAITRCLDRIVAEMSHWLPTSLLSRFNQADGGHWVTLPHDFAAVMAAGLKIAERSGGTFDPALGQLTDLWGLGPNPRTGEPRVDQIAAALAVSGWRRMRFNAGTRQLYQPGGVWLDLSGIAKGYASDAVSAVLARAGVHHALVEIGGECVGRGIRPDGDPWWAELETPPGISLPPLRVALHQMAVATSGDYVRGAHTLDPRTGYPVKHGTAAVSVLHGTAMIADAWASALTVMPPAVAMQTATRELLAVRIIDRTGGEWLSPTLQEML